jgi:peptidoglycan/xylan/chitin deacetylase (PgdA/CDA1 family)
VSLQAWPDGAAAAVSLTFDVDAESVFLGQGLGESASLSAFSERRFGITRGLPRILELLAARGIRGTFYTPGWTADRYPDAIRAIVEDGHELAHHGYLHRPPNLIDAAGQREELERGIEALRKITGEAPRGYRSPSWELTEETLALLAEFGFAYDSSRMGDDRPYVETVAGSTLVELPVHWSLDDFPYYSWQEANRGPMSDPATVSAIWLAEFREALLEGGHVTYTAHPEVSGRRSRIEALKALIDEMQSTDNVWFATHGEIADLVLVAERTREASWTRQG